uniref:Polyprotein n=1 Tax=Acrobeloides nanus TaxID=290746 RepID=A0A914D3I5_9BILA
MSAHQSRRDQERQRELVQRRRSPSGRRHTFPVSAKTTPEQIIRHVERFIIPVREKSVANRLREHRTREGSPSARLPDTNTLLNITGENFDQQIHDHFDQEYRAGRVRDPGRYDFTFQNIQVHIAYMQNDGRTVRRLTRAQADVTFLVDVNIQQGFISTSVGTTAFHMMNPPQNIRNEEEIWPNNTGRALPPQIYILPGKSEL